MSIEAISRALQSKIPGSSNKFVLVALANYADEKMMSYPSTERLCADTSMDRKTVFKSLSWLRENGVIEDSGERKGNTAGVVVYRLLGLRTGPAEIQVVPKKELLKTYPKNGTSTKNGTGKQYQISHEAVPFFPGKQYQISHEAVPFFPGSSTKNGTQNLIGTVSEPSVNLTVSEPVASAPKKRAARAPKPGGVETWNAYSSAYQGRYGVAPTVNAMIRGQIARFCDRVPVLDAPMIAAFYVQHQSSFYVLKMHPVGLLLADAEKLRTEWATNRRMTTTAARQADKTAANGQVWIDLINEVRDNDGKLA